MSAFGPRVEWNKRVDLGPCGEHEAHRVEQARRRDLRAECDERVGRLGGEPLGIGADQERRAVHEQDGRVTHREGAIVGGPPRRAREGERSAVPHERRPRDEDVGGEPVRRLRRRRGGGGPSARCYGPRAPPDPPVFDVAEPVGPWTTVLVYIPRGRFAGGVASKIADVVAEHYGGETRDLETLLGASSLARISMTVRAVHRVDLEVLAQAVDDLTTTWSELAESALVDALGEIEGRRVFAAVHSAVPKDYQARVRPAAAVGDLLHVAQLMGASDVTRDETSSVIRPSEATELGIVTSLGRSVDADAGHWRFRVFIRDRATTLSDLVPILETLGLHAVDERPARFAFENGSVHLHDIGVRVDVPEIDDQQSGEVQRSFVGLMRSTIEADGLNELVLAAGLSVRQVAVLRLYHRYLRQAAFAFSPAYIEQSIVRHPEIAADLAELFDVRFDPGRFQDMDRREPPPKKCANASSHDSTRSRRSTTTESAGRSSR